ncbi:MAG: phosphate-starvation-inducible PsiE family protein [Gammaproteobacteria bacterium]|nr:phosphate-starvation-inducible PsiE family protein [Gammaproteobacteria bacterium]
MISSKLKKVFDRVVDFVFSVILIFIILAIAIGTVQLFVSLWNLLAFKGITGNYIGIISDVLTLYVLIELSRSLVEYFNTSKLRLTFIVDAAIVFIIRELLITLFRHEAEPPMLYALAAVLLVLGALRVSSVIVYQREQRPTAHVHD